MLKSFQELIRSTHTHTHTHMLVLIINYVIPHYSSETKQYHSVACELLAFVSNQRAKKKKKIKYCQIKFDQKNVTNVQCSGYVYGNTTAKSSQ